MVLLFFGSCSCEEVKLNIPEWVTNALFDSKDIGKNYEKNASIIVSGDFKLCKGAKGVYPISIDKVCDFPKQNKTIFKYRDELADFLNNNFLSMCSHRETLVSPALNRMIFSCIDIKFNKFFITDCILV